MVRFDSAHRAVHYPPDRRFRIWIRPSILNGLGIAILSVIVAAWIEVAGSRTAMGSGCSANISKQLRGATRLSGMGAILPFLQFSFRDDAHSQRPFDTNGSPASLFQ
jgi:hypothetical protein